MSYFIIAVMSMCFTFAILKGVTISGWVFLALVIMVVGIYIWKKCKEPEYDPETRIEDFEDTHEQFSKE